MAMSMPRQSASRATSPRAASPCAAYPRAASSRAASRTATLTPPLERKRETTRPEYGPRVNRQAHAPSVEVRLAHRSLPFPPASYPYHSPSLHPFFVHVLRCALGLRVVGYRNT
jgi:hypothetical protein